MSNNPERPTDDNLLAHTYKIEGRVTAMEGVLSQLGTQLSRMEAALMNKPPIWNVSNIMGIVGMVGALMWGLSGYVDLQLNNLQYLQDHSTDAVTEINQRLEALRTFQSEVHFEIGGIKEGIESLNDGYDWMYESHVSIEERLRGVETND